MDPDCLIVLCSRGWCRIGRRRPLLQWITQDLAHRSRVRVRLALDESTLVAEQVDGSLRLLEEMEALEPA